MGMNAAWAGGLLLALLILLQTAPAQADIFKKRLPDGTLCFTNTPMGGDWDLYLHETKGNKYRFRRPSSSEMVRRSNYDGIIRRTALYFSSLFVI